MDLKNSGILEVARLSPQLNTMRSMVILFKDTLPHAYAVPEQGATGGVVREGGEAVVRRSCWRSLRWTRRQQRREALRPQVKLEPTGLEATSTAEVATLSVSRERAKGTEAESVHPAAGGNPRSCRRRFASVADVCASWVNCWTQFEVLKMLTEDKDSKSPTIEPISDAKL